VIRVTRLRNLLSPSFLIWAAAVPRSTWRLVGLCHLAWFVICRSWLFVAMTLTLRRTTLYHLHFPLEALFSTTLSSPLCVNKATLLFRARFASIPQPYSLVPTAMCKARQGPIHPFTPQERRLCGQPTTSHTFTELPCCPRREPRRHYSHGVSPCALFCQLDGVISRPLSTLRAAHARHAFASS
jgi:hypothetical protein